MFNRHRGWGAWATVCAVVAIAAGCNRGKEWCGPCEPGYGTLHVTTKFEDEYTESVAEGAGATMSFLLILSEDKVTDCYDYHLSGSLVDTRTTALDLNRTFQLPEGWACAFTDGTGPSEEGPSYYNDCEGGLGPSRVSECDCVDEALDVSCELEWDGSG